MQQLVSFIQSSIELKHPDKQVAIYLSKLRLSERLDARAIEELQGLGAGPATVEALRKLAVSAASLPTPAPQTAKAAPPPIAPPPVGVQKALLERVREYAINYSKNLPNFFCTEVIRRYRDDTGQEYWVNYDTLTARLSYFDQKEEYKLVMINNRATEEAYGSVGGTISSGEFGSMLKEIFEPDSEATFAWLRWATLRGKRAHVYTYRVPRSNSQWRVAYQRSQETIVGYTGLVYVDRETEMILKVTLNATEIPAGFPIQQASDALDYDYTKINEQTYLLPLKAEVRLSHGKQLTKNIVEFHLYRKFGVDTSVTFATPDALPEEKTKEEPPQ